jgi:hypothetical protein
MLPEHVSEFLTAYCHGELGADASHRVAVHLRQCARCRAEYEEMRFAVHAGEHLTPVSAPEGLWDSITAALDDPQQVARAAGEREPGWRGWRELLPTWPVVATACATLLLGVWLGYRFVRPQSLAPLIAATPGVRTDLVPSHAGLAPVYYDLSSYLGPIQAAGRVESYSVITRALPQFTQCAKKTLLDLGLENVLERTSPLEGFELQSHRLHDYEDRKVVQLVYAGGGEAFSVFVGPSDVEFKFGQEYSYETTVGGIRCRKVDCPYQRSYAFGQNSRKYVIVSKSLDDKRALAVMQYFLNAEAVEIAAR